MNHKDLYPEELLNVLKNTVDTIWLISLEDYSVKILADSMMPGLVGLLLDFEQLEAVYLKNCVYPPDVEKWKEMLSASSLKEMAAKKCRKKVFEMRFCNEVFGFEWHQTFLDLLEREEGAGHILLTSRHVNNFKKAGIIEKAVDTEYDYVVYIEADKNSYVMYTTNHETGTPVPPVASNNYEAEVSRFHRRYLPIEQQEDLTKQLSIAHVQPILEASGEYVLLCKVMENGVYRDKKMRFSYYDQNKNIWLLTRTDITEIREEKRQKELLQDALNAATAANRAKSEFLSRMSHDIRTPMNAIMGMTAIAGAHLEDQERIADCLGKINSSSRLLLSLINEVLDMAKVESGSIVLSEENIELPALIQNIVNMIQPMIDKKKQFFEAHILQVKNELVIGDSQRLQQVFLNLLSNATKYTRENGHILLEIREIPSHEPGLGCFEFSVTDDGIGMKPEFLKKVFEPFERADDETLIGIPGTGLGMAISRNIVEMMGGAIQADSTYGSGSKFTATVCLKLQDQPQWDMTSLAGLPILVVDDDKAVCQDVCERLNALGMNAKSAYSGKSAIEKIEAAHDGGEDYFAVIMDLRMPDMDGIETTRQIRTKIGSDIPVIMISAYDWSEYEDRARKAGVNGFIVKPLFQSRLIYKLKQLILKEPARAQQVFPSLPYGDYSQKRILLAEDNELNREIAEELLSSVNLTVESTENGWIAVEMVKSHPENYYDLIFMDMQMPVMDGCQAAREIRQLEKEGRKKIPIIAMTANAFADDIERTKQAGMDEHLSKPIDMELLSQTLARWLL